MQNYEAIEEAALEMADDRLLKVFGAPRQRGLRLLDQATSPRKLKLLPSQPAATSRLFLFLLICASLSPRIMPLSQ